MESSLYQTVVSSTDTYLKNLPFCTADVNSGKNISMPMRASKSKHLMKNLLKNKTKKNHLVQVTVENMTLLSTSMDMMLFLKAEQHVPQIKPF